MMTSTPPQTLVSPQSAEIGASIRVAVLSEQVLLSHVLRNALVGRDGIDVVFHVAGPGQPATLVELAESNPDVVLVSAMTDDDAPFIHDVIEAVPTSRVIVLSGTSDSDLVVRAFGAGAAGYLALRLPLSKVVDVISGDARGSARPAAASAQRRGRGDSPHGLTNREQEVLRLVASGLSTRAIAAELDVTLATVRTHTQSILSKLDVHSKVEAAAYAVRHNLT